MSSSSTPRSRHRAALLATLALTLAGTVTPRLLAQADTGRIAGTVTDTTGAAIPNATLTLVNPATGLTLTGTSNGAGELNVPAVPPGNYQATVSAQGFGKQAQPITVQVTQNLTLTFHLAPGEAATTVNVTDAAQLVDTTDSTLGEIIQGKQITELPLNGRNALTLALLTPGVTQGPIGDTSQDTVNRNANSGGGAISVNGLRLQANNFILDGVDNNDGLQNDIVFFPDVEATQEFQVDTSIAPAQYGRAGGALVIASIRSGTNQIHGSAFEFNRSGAYDANPNYQTLGAAATPNPAFSRNQFGGSAGLPLIKDKLFLFGDYAGYRESTPINVSYHTVPTALMRQGNFSELMNPALNGGTLLPIYPKCYPNATALNATPNNGASHGYIFDPTTCAPFDPVNNTIPQDRLNPAAVNYLNAYPMPTRTDRILNNYQVQQRQASNYNTFDARLDWHPSNSDIFFFRASYDNSDETLTSVLAPTLPAGSGTGANYVHARGYDLGYTHTFTPDIVNEARIEYLRYNFGYQPPLYGDPVSANLGIVNANRNIETSGGALIGGTNEEIEYTGDYGLYAVPENTYEATDTINITKGKHVIQTGGTFLRRQVNFFRPIAGKGFFNIASYGADFTGYEITELLAGGVDNYQIGAQNGFFGNINQEDAVFFQDDWRVTPRLTLNLGVRWDLLTWPYEMHDNAAAFNPNDGTVMLAGKNGVRDSIVNQDYLNFAPRVGFAYSLDPQGRSALRGGYGIFYFPDYGGISNQFGQQPPFGGSVTYQAYNGYCITFTGQTATTGTPYGCNGYTSPQAVTTALPAPGFSNFNPAAPPQGLSGLAVDVNNKHSRLQEYNLQLQEQLGNKDVFTIAYVGVHGDRLSTYYPLNSYYFGATTLPFENLSSISDNVYNGVSNYNAMQLHYEHRAGDLLLTGSYTWSHALDDSPGAFQGSTVQEIYDPHLDYGNSNQDIRDNASMSGLYELPFGRGKRFDSNANRFTELAIGGWQLNLTAFLQSGQPFDLSTGSPGGIANANRPDLVRPISYQKSISGHWFDPTLVSSAIPTITSTDGKDQTVYTRIGTLGRNQFYGPSYRVANFGVQKNLHFTDRITLELHGDAFNVLNTPQFTNPGSNESNASTFGVITGTRANSSREIQLASRLTF